MTESSAVLIVSASERDANMYYATRFLAPDPFIYIEARGKRILIASDLEVDRARAQAKVDEVLQQSKLAQQYAQNGKPAAASELVAGLLKDSSATQVAVPSDFPLALADRLRQHGLAVTAKPDPFFESRVVKTDEEVRCITQTQRDTEAAVEEAMKILAQSRVDGERLVFDGTALTAERIKEIINLELMRRGCVAQHTIVAGGLQAVDPHEQGHGPLPANLPIVMDVFPQSSRTRYYADMTRTVVRGKASDKIKRMYAAVQQGQEAAIRRLRAGVDGFDIHQAILESFVAQGFQTGQIGGRMQGFFHGTGHGLGLEVHEPPRIGAGHDILRAGTVVTVEPGLYYTDAGGIRIEDLVVVTETGCVNLTKMPKVLEI